MRHRFVGSSQNEENERGTPLVVPKVFRKEDQKTMMTFNFISNVEYSNFDRESSQSLYAKWTKEQNGNALIVLMSREDGVKQFGDAKSDPDKESLANYLLLIETTLKGKLNGNEDKKEISLLNKGIKNIIDERCRNLGHSDKDNVTVSVNCLTM